MTSSTADVKDEDAAVRRRFAAGCPVPSAWPSSVDPRSSGFRAAATQDEVCAPFGGTVPAPTARRARKSRCGTRRCGTRAAARTACGRVASARSTTHDPALPGCGDALAAYRSAANCSCNCSASTPTWRRERHPHLGGADDRDQHRPRPLVDPLPNHRHGARRLEPQKTAFGVVWVTGGILFFGAAVLAPGGVWVVGLVAGPLRDLRQPEGARVAVCGRRDDSAQFLGPAAWLPFLPSATSSQRSPTTSRPRRCSPAGRARRWRSSSTRHRPPARPR